MIIKNEPAKDSKRLEGFNSETFLIDTSLQFFVASHLRFLNYDQLKEHRSRRLVDGPSDRGC